MNKSRNVSIKKEICLMLRNTDIKERKELYYYKDKFIKKIDVKEE